MSFLGLLRFLISAGMVIALNATSPAFAVGICKCDNAKGFENACLPVCKEANEKTSFFRPAVYFGNDTKVNSDKAPLNGTSMKFLYMPQPNREGMELFRRFLEGSRKKAENEYQGFRKAYLRGHVGPEEFFEAEKMRDEALVNYQHSMQTYLNTPSPR